MPPSLELQRGDCGPGEQTLLALRTVLDSLTETKVLLTVKCHPMGVSVGGQGVFLVCFSVVFCVCMSAF